MNPEEGPEGPYWKLVVVRSSVASGQNWASQERLVESELFEIPGIVAAQVFGLVDVPGRATPTHNALTLLECHRPPTIDIAHWLATVVGVARSGRSVSIFVPISNRIAADRPAREPRPVGQNIHFVETNAIGGREDEFNDWYTRVHIDDVLRVPGFVAGQRFEQRVPFSDRPPRHRYLAIYEVTGDPVAADGRLRTAVKDMVISPAMQQGDSHSNYFAPLTSRMVT